MVFVGSPNETRTGWGERNRDLDETDKQTLFCLYIRIVLSLFGSRRSLETGGAMHGSKFVETMEAWHRRRGTVAAGLVLDFYEMPCCSAILLFCFSSFCGTLFQFIVVFL